jgi:hypothetical protein
LIIDYETDHYLVVAKVKEGLALNKQRLQRFHMERFGFKKLSKAESKGKCCVEVSDLFAALEELGTKVDVNSAWEMIIENIKISAKKNLGCYELKTHGLMKDAHNQ